MMINLFRIHMTNMILKFKIKIFLKIFNKLIILIMIMIFEIELCTKEFKKCV